MERVGISFLDKNYDLGIYECVGCEFFLFFFEIKFNFGIGWFSFYVFLENVVVYIVDKFFFMICIEVYCVCCGGYLGYVFDDGF